MPVPPAAHTRSSEISFLLFPLHRRRAVVVDDAAAPFGMPALQRLLDDFGNRARRTLDGAGQRIAAQRAYPYQSELRALAGLQRQPLIVDHDQRAVAHHHRTRRRKIERYHRNALAMDVEPDVELGPVRQRKHADAFAAALAPVVDAPRLGPLPLRVPDVPRVAQREHALLGARLFLVAPRAAQRGVSAV